MTNSKDLLELEQFLNLARGFLSVLSRHWLSAVSVFGSVMVLTAIQAFSEEPVYKATGKLLFERISGTSSLTGGGAEKLGRLDILAPESDPLLTEAEVIRSRTVAEWAIAALNQTDSGHSTLAKDEGFCNPERPYPISPMPHLTFTPRQIGMRSGELLSNELATPQSSLRPEVFLSQLQVRRIPGTDIMEISYISNSPQEAFQRGNALMLAYLEYSNSARQGDIGEALINLEGQVDRAEKEWKEAELELTSFKKSKVLVNLQRQAELKLRHIQEIEILIEKLEAELNAVTSQFASIQNQLGLDLEQAMVAISVVQDPELQATIKEIQRLKVELAAQETRFKDNNPIIDEIKGKINGLQNLLKEQVNAILVVPVTDIDEKLQIGILRQGLVERLVLLEAQRTGLRSQIEDLNYSLQRHKQIVDGIPDLEEKQRELERKRDISQATYSSLLSKLQSLQASKEQKVINARILECALLPQGPVPPRTKLNLILGAISALMLSVIIAFVVELIELASRNLGSKPTNTKSG
ncbi:MAG: hypothetical protein F6J93_32510 [Oscillatoria sp. SIO1A7]|nr:hypothetical protein [Oscillatoria sp. SIO1A7]